MIYSEGAEQCWQIFLTSLTCINEWAGPLLLMLKGPTAVDSPNPPLPGTERYVSSVCSPIILPFILFQAKSTKPSRFTPRSFLFFFSVKWRVKINNYAVLSKLVIIQSMQHVISVIVFCSSAAHLLLCERGHQSHTIVLHGAIQKHSITDTKACLCTSDGVN